MASKRVVDSRDQLLFKVTSINNEKLIFGGYKQEILVNSLKKVEREFYICTKCNGLMRNACEYGEQETQVCESCVGKENAQPVAKPRRKISGLKSKCPLKKRGCPWKGRIAEVDAHLLQCPEFIVECKDKCGVALKRSEQETHSKKCQLRDVNCKYCQSVIVFGELEHHYRFCLEIPILCPRKCQKSLIRKEVDSHLEKDCPNSLIECVNKCGITLKRSDSVNRHQKVCENRDIDCKYCKEVIVFNSMQTHNDACPEFPITCPNDCLKNLTRKEVESHINSICPNTVVECENGCGENGKRSEMGRHHRKECQRREVNCRHCKTVILFKDIETHDTTCQDFPLACPNECMRDITRKDMESHIQDECPNTILECPYVKMGCTELIKRSEIAEHKKNFEITHLKTGTFYALNRAEQIEVKFLEMEKENSDLRETNELLSNRTKIMLQRMDVKMTKIEMTNEDLRRENKQLATRVQVLEKYLDEFKQLENRNKRNSLDEKLYKLLLPSHETNIPEPDLSERETAL